MSNFKSATYESLALLSKGIPNGTFFVRAPSVKAALKIAQRSALIKDVHQIFSVASPKTEKQDLKDKSGDQAERIGTWHLEILEDCESHLPSGPQITYTFLPCTFQSLNRRGFAALTTFDSLKAPQPLLETLNTAFRQLVHHSQIPTTSFDFLLLHNPSTASTPQNPSQTWILTRPLSLSSTIDTRIASIRRKRHLGPTSLPVLHSRIQLNLSHVRKGAIILDPCCGSGSVFASAEGSNLVGGRAGGLCVGGDVRKDYFFCHEQTRAAMDTEREVTTELNTTATKMTSGAVDHILMNMLRPALCSRLIFDAIVTDLPYDIRASIHDTSSESPSSTTETTSTKNHNIEVEPQREKRSGDQKVLRMVHNLMETACRVLVPGGRCSFWIAQNPQVEELVRKYYGSGPTTDVCIVLESVFSDGGKPLERSLFTFVKFSGENGGEKEKGGVMNQTTSTDPSFTSLDEEHIDEDTDFEDNDDVHLIPTTHTTSHSETTRNPIMTPDPAGPGTAFELARRNNLPALVSHLEHLALSLKSYTQSNPTDEPCTTPNETAEQTLWSTLRDSRGKTLLHHGAGYGSHIVTAYLCQRFPFAVNERACSPSHPSTKGKSKRRGPIAGRDRLGPTALHLAARFGHIAVVTSLLQNGADPFMQDEEGKNAVALGCGFGHVGVVKEILEWDGKKEGPVDDGENENERERGKVRDSYRVLTLVGGSGGVSPLEEACRYGKTPCAEAVLEALLSFFLTHHNHHNNTQPKPSTEPHQLALHDERHVQDDAQGENKQVKETENDWNWIRDALGRGFRAACQWGHLSCVNLFLHPPPYQIWSLTCLMTSTSTSPNSSAPSFALGGDTALHLAAKYARKDIVRVLIDAMGGKWMDDDRCGAWVGGGDGVEVETEIKVERETGRVSLLEYVLGIRNAQGLTPLEVAATRDIKRLMTGER
ncbi:hypothetical protein HK102_011639 [Quaeritorhiza haematococci]|nr:hypothetical protein HK102_011639 [Quaeritorhiza haematococci]